MEMMKKIMEAVTHLMKSFEERKNYHHQGTLQTLYFFFHLLALEERFSAFTYPLQNFKMSYLKIDLTIRGHRKPLNLSLNLVE